MNLFGSMSTTRLSSFFTRMSPCAVFCIRWIVIAPTRREIAFTAVDTSGECARLV